MKRIILGLGLALSLGLAQSAVTIPRLTTPVVIDGVLDDWAPPPLIVIDHTMTADADDITDDDDLSLEVWAAYDDTTFYLAANIRDDVAIFEQSALTLYENDSLEFWLGASQFAVALVEGRVVIYQYTTPTVAIDPNDLELGFQYTDLGYSIELAIPLSVVAELLGEAAGAGVSFPFAVGANDADEIGGRRSGQLYFPESWAWNQPQTFAIATLGE